MAASKVMPPAGALDAMRPPAPAPLAVLALAALLLAGCSSGSSPAPPPSPTAEPTPTPHPWILLPEPEPAFTDVLHLLAWPEATPASPAGGDDVVLVIEPFLDQSASGRFDDTWQVRPRDGLAHVVGNASIWVEVTGEILPNPNPLVGGCFWDLSLTIGDLDTGEFHGLDCVSEPSPVPTGVRRLDFKFDLRGVDVPAGEVMHVELHTQDWARAAGAEARILTGTAAHDSQVLLLGLQVPVAQGLLDAVGAST